jgi:hypothetical protein
MLTGSWLQSRKENARFENVCRTLAHAVISWPR